MRTNNPRNMNTVTEPLPSSSGVSPTPPRAKVGIVPIFSTYIYQCENGPTHLNEGLLQLAHQLMQDERNATRRTNAGGWHYAFDIFALNEPLLAEFHNH